jgi:hypothetical protein
MRTPAVLALLLAACASSNRGAQVIRPELTITQTSGVPQAARNVQGNVSVRYKVRVANRASEPITLARLTLQSVGAGAYTVSDSRTVGLTIAPDQYQDVDFWATARTMTSVVGANGPVTLRIVAHFDSPDGPFEDISIQTVNAMGTIGSEPR